MLESVPLQDDLPQQQELIARIVMDLFLRFLTLERDLVRCLFILAQWHNLPHFESIPESSKKLRGSASYVHVRCFSAFCLRRSTRS
jgi:hypothetical protein